MNDDQESWDLPPTGSVDFNDWSEGKGPGIDSGSLFPPGQPSNRGHSSYVSSIVATGAKAYWKGLYQAPFAPAASRTGAHAGLEAERTDYAEPASRSGKIRIPKLMLSASSQTVSTTKTRLPRGHNCGRCRRRRKRCEPSLNGDTCLPCEKAGTDCTSDPDVNRSTGVRLSPASSQTASTTTTRLPRSHNCDQCSTRRTKCTPGLDGSTCSPCKEAGTVCTRDRNTYKKQGRKSRRFGEGGSHASGSHASGSQVSRS
jgi:hypothetical protein